MPVLPGTNLTEGQQGGGPSAVLGAGGWQWQTQDSCSSAGDTQKAGSVVPGPGKSPREWGRGRVGGGGAQIAQIDPVQLWRPQV